MKSITNSDFADQLANAVLHFVKDKIELVMKEEIKNFLHVEHPDTPNTRNGYYPRTLETRFGKIEELQVPRDRQGDFQTQIFEPYQRRDGWLEEAVIRMYKGGMSTRDVAGFIEQVIGTHYSPTTISNITHTVMEDIQAWQNRPLKKRYSVVYLDGLYFSLRRDSVAKEAIYVAMGIDEDGYRQILGFYVGGIESAHGWKELLQGLYRRGATEVLLGVFDGLTGLEEAFHSVYPKADVQRCVVHKIRNTFPKIRVKDKVEFLDDLKQVYTAPSREDADKQFYRFEAKWEKRYPKEIASWRDDLPVLLTFYKYPEDIRKSIYTTNVIERTIKEFRKRLYPMNSIPNVEAAEKIVYLVVHAYNERWATRIIRGFGMENTKQALEAMFQKRYEKSTESADLEM
ncbi:IS256 family transposase [Paenibacillus sp. NEAU-GSW1]|uniref:IS256 family transposase n=1 Tax=Paenibacillus sp. NEAU-GSW1 TaxID=2682486 RepID=UPI0012E1168E|nr:IS256 family transposase [Paenibacillus sp. NEAU-GSW1]MUT66967.1 IS256 family transposase [Paenibacillus sp. NEAU-GSW1]